MMWYYGSGGWSWLWMTLIMLVFWGGVIAVAVWAIRSVLGSRRETDALGSRRETDAMDVLRRRLATGEISQDDFEKTKRILQG